LLDNNLYLPEPDYQRPLFKLSKNLRKQLYEMLFDLYGRWGAADMFEELAREMVVHAAYRRKALDQEQAGCVKETSDLEGVWVLELAAERLLSLSRKELKLLNRFCTDTLGFEKCVLWSSEFVPSVKFKQLMFDGVFARVPLRDQWFEDYLNGYPQYKGFFLAYSSCPGQLDDVNPAQESSPQRSRFVRFHTLAGERWVLADFRLNQLELNYKDPLVLLNVIRRLLLQVRRGASWIHLGEVPRHLLESGIEPMQHVARGGVLALLAKVLKVVAPEMRLLYSPCHTKAFPSGNTHGQVVVGNLMRVEHLTPLVLYLAMSGESEVLNRWLVKHFFSNSGLSFFDFSGAEQILDMGERLEGLADEEKLRLKTWLLSRGATVVKPKSEQEGQDGEIVRFHWGELLRPYGVDPLWEKQFVSLRSIPMVLAGVPGFGVEEMIFGELSLGFIGTEMKRLLAIRSKRAAFSPQGEQRVLFIHANAFVILRISPQGRELILCLVNLIRKAIAVELKTAENRLPDGTWMELISGEKLSVSSTIRLELAPFDVRWYLCSAMEETVDNP